jgi:bifunctional pyridoxal-dependent enzyme with beta-cystathionase and maltose regulon repressor activities
MSYVLFISENKLKDSTAINMNVDVEFLLPFVKQAQKLYVETKLGTDLNQKLKDLITAGTLNNAGNEAYATLVNTGEYYMERMIEYIKNNTSSFPEYSTNSGADVTPDSNAYYAGMNLERPKQQGTKLTLRDFLTPDLT